ncbi:hypothetical protein AZE42_08677 [Rhizopogon vesiculosus]|uniref:non-specific serine/threonine protein kinase n=1 Tax=Rhizopogon vesiculosus TaxID=180088 RepID=A0A1J8R1W7_9AGAM|nr:hypothetical protein AZE42_08677 [Rhizopogon vesiculosus]
MLPGGRLRLNKNVTLKLITPPRPSKPQLSSAPHLSETPQLPRLQDTVSFKTAITARRAQHHEPQSYSSSVDNSVSALPQVEKLGSLTETPQVPQSESNASSTAPLSITIPSLKPQSVIAEDIDPHVLPTELLELRYPFDWEPSAVNPPRAPTVPLTPPHSPTIPLTPPRSPTIPLTPPRSPTVPLTTPRTNKVESRFRILRVLQNGGFAAAWGVKDTSSGRLLCMKVFREEWPKRLPTETGILKELQVYKRIATSKTTSVGKMFVMELEMSFRAHGDRICFVMDLMTNDLHHYMVKHSDYCSENARRWAAQMALGIRALHDMGIIHRDIKPENILIDARENIRIADFGLSYIQQKPLRSWEVYTLDVMGTIECMAPEILANEHNPDPRYYGVTVDWWSYGCVLYELFSADHMPLFPTVHVINRYVLWTSKYGGVNPFRGLAKLPKCKLGLVQGLLNPSVRERFCFEDVRDHPYFATRDHGTDFDVVCSRALERIECPQLLPDLKGEEGEELDPLPPRMCGRGPKCCPDVDWVNPRSGIQ